jgi:hypothetical protein
MSKPLQGEIKFIHFVDGKEYHFVTAPNDLSDAQMFSWDNWHGCFSSTEGHVKSIIRGIKKKATRIISTTL